MAEATGGPAPYAKGSDTLLCPVCALYNDPDARFCDQCSVQLQERPGAYQLRPKDIVRCPHCPASNQPDAVYCDQCGWRLPHAAYAAAKAAAGAKQATSSSGRQPTYAELARRGRAPTDSDLEALERRVAEKEAELFGSGRRPEGAASMTPQERTEYLDGLALREQRQRALGLAPITGDILHDAAAAEERASEIQVLWERLDDLARQAEYEAGPFPAPATVAEVRRLRADADSAWAARQVAVRARDALWMRADGRTPEQDEAEARRFEALMRRARRNSSWG